MKRTQVVSSIVVLLLSVSGALAAGETNASSPTVNAPFDHTQGLINSCSFTPIQISLFPPVQLFSSDTEVRGVRLNLLMGYNTRVDGFDVGVIMSLADELNGVQIGFINQAICFTGLQVGLMNVDFVGFARPIRGSHTDQRSATSRSQGIQIGVMNCIGAGPGVADDPSSSFSGLQIGIMNFADEMKGVQISSVINAANEITGLQIGLINTAKILNGVQIGLINRADNGVLFHPFPGEVYGFPIINMAFE